MKIIITGPESAGKSQLTRDLASHYQAPGLVEYARDYLEALDRPYEESDLLKIAEGHLQREADLQADQQPLIFIDTALVVIKIWGMYKYGRTDPWIEAKLRDQQNTYYLLCAPDLPWEEDPLRENPHDREVLFDMYHTALKDLNQPSAIIYGYGQERLNNAIKVVEEWRK